MDNTERAEWGEAAVTAGDPDWHISDDDQTSLGDALANMMHWAQRKGLNFQRALEDAETNYLAEMDTI